MSAESWILPAVSIHRISVGGMDNNVYVITGLQSGEQVLIDAADDADAILALLAEGARDAAPGTAKTAQTPALLVTTHSHWDHIRALGPVIAATGAKTAAGRDDAGDIEVPTDDLLDHGDVRQFDGFELQVIGLRGHTPGSVALLYRDSKGPAHLFTGDSLFPGGVGNTQKDPNRFARLLDDVATRVFAVLPDDTLVHPGHGAGTTLGAERPHLDEWRARGW
ncbi:MBL fold metallo-hydrolase [Paenarthrobacter sp. PH39-S1]|uniref:MBL fold metallo-hydrolase n=1 Tax=Paenarthrobacter sp. PH39-S1 TaxID=3046204 RepID=UPI0024BA07C1|nr:MBL fold metallo-hydrolase [Paenarthrobacter sp. PH39-S1]MDJ0357853.1 MBL fold metallo-hydrolase [Paenarthrobacter sp. PH39-S1]